MNTHRAAKDPAGLVEDIGPIMHANLSRSSTATMAAKSEDVCLTRRENDTTDVISSTGKALPAVEAEEKEKKACALRDCSQKRQLMVRFATVAKVSKIAAYATPSAKSCCFVRMFEISRYAHIFVAGKFKNQRCL